jgi:hypothetical protein
MLHLPTDSFCPSSCLCLYGQLAESNHVSHLTDDKDVEQVNRMLLCDGWDGRVIGYKCAVKECVSNTRYLRVTIVQLTYTNSSFFVVRFSVDVCVRACV